MAIEIRPSLDVTTLPGAQLRSDSRQVRRGDVFAALGEGEALARHVADARNRGAAAILVDAASPAAGDGIHRVRGLAAALGTIADEFYGCPSRELSLVGVTGTNGKTSTVQFLAQAWERLGRCSATIGTLGAGLSGRLVPTGLTTPSVTVFHELLAAFRAEGVEAVAAEVSSHALAQNRVAGARFDLVAITNITRDHLDYHGSMAAYASAKRRILDLPGVRTAVVNLDDSESRGSSHPRVESIGVTTRGAPGAFVAAENIVVDTEGAAFDLRVDSTTHPVRTRVLGRFNVDNVVVVAGILFAQGVAGTDIAEALRATSPIPGRMQQIPRTQRTPRVIIDYAHTPDALQHALSAGRTDGGRLIAVFGCTGDRDRGKRPLMGRVASTLADFIILTDDDLHDEDGDTIIDDVLPGLTDPDGVVIIRQRHRAIRAAIGMARPGDTVLIAGKGHESAQVIRGRSVPSDDLVHARRALAAVRQVGRLR